VILVDANLLIYAIDADSPQRRRARPWLEQVLSGRAPVGLPWIVILAFIRITTRAGIMRRPLPLADALAYVESWLQQPCVEATAPGTQHSPILCRLLEATGTAGNLTSDAHIAGAGTRARRCDLLDRSRFRPLPRHPAHQPLGRRLIAHRAPVASAWHRGSGSGRSLRDASGRTRGHGKWN
jgi:toxin-antitoxin system PIN domain toxin